MNSPSLLLAAGALALFLADASSCEDCDEGGGTATPGVEPATATATPTPQAPTATSTTLATATPAVPTATSTPVAYPAPAHELVYDEIGKFSDEDYVWTLRLCVTGAVAEGGWAGIGRILVWPSLAAHDAAPADPPCVITQAVAGEALGGDVARTCAGCVIYHQVEATSATAAGTCPGDSPTRVAAAHRFGYHGFRPASNGWPADAGEPADLAAVGYVGAVYDLVLDPEAFSAYYLARPVESCPP